MRNTRGTAIEKGALCFAAAMLSWTFAAPAAAVVLHDNGPIVNCPGCGAGGADESQAQNVSLSMITLGFPNHPALTPADDFDVTDPDGWNISVMTFFTYMSDYTPATPATPVSPVSPVSSPIRDVRYQVWNGPPGGPGSEVVHGFLSSNDLWKTGWTGIYRTAEDTSGSTNRAVMFAEVVSPRPFHLPRGTYWIEWWAVGASDLWLTGPWAPPITIEGESVTGNAVRRIGEEYVPVLDQGTSTRQGFPFIIEGRAGCPAGAYNRLTGGLYLPEVQVSGSGSFQVELIQLPGSGYSFEVLNATWVPTSSCPTARYNKSTGALVIDNLRATGFRGFYSATLHQRSGPGYVFDLGDLSKI